MSRACAPDDVLGACVAVPLAICLPRVLSLLFLAWYWFLRSLFLSLVFVSFGRPFCCCCYCCCCCFSSNHYRDGNVQEQGVCDA